MSHACQCDIKVRSAERHASVVLSRVTYSCSLFPMPPRQADQLQLCGQSGQAAAASFLDISIQLTILILFNVTSMIIRTQFEWNEISSEIFPHVPRLLLQGAIPAHPPFMIFVDFLFCPRLLFRLYSKSLLP